MNKSKRTLLQKERPSATALLVLFLDEYGFEALDWDIETVIMELEEDSQVSLSDMAISKLASAIKVLTDDSFLTSLPDFIILCNALAGDEGLQDTWNPADAYDITQAMTEFRTIVPFKKDTFIDPEILGYITIVLRSSHILTPPDCLNFISSEELAIRDVGTAMETPELLSASYESTEFNSDSLQEAADTLRSQIAEELQLLELERGSTDFLTKGKDGENRRDGAVPRGPMANTVRSE